MSLAYGMGPKNEILPFLLALNLEIANSESTSKAVQGPGIPAGGKKVELLISSDRVEMQALVK